jgi:hypothetical protein
VAAVVEAIVRPAAELAESGWRGRCCLLIIAELAEEDPDTLAEEVVEELDRTGGNEVYASLSDRLATVPQDVLNERLALVTVFMRRRKGRAQLDHETFVKNLIAMAAAAVSAPLTRAIDVKNSA